MILQVQPKYKDAAAWEAFLRKEGTAAEVIELSIPAAVSAKEAAMESSDLYLTEKCSMEEKISWYRNLPCAKSLHGQFIDNNPGSNDPDIAALSIRKLEESCKLAKSLHIRRVVFHSGAVPFLRGDYLTGWAGVCASVYQRLADRYDLELFIENSQDVDASPLMELMQQTEDPRVRVCLDIGHANYSRETLRDWFRRLEPYIGYLHLSDNNGYFDDHLCIGKGTVDWEEVNRLASAMDPETPATLETGSLANTGASLRFLKQNGYFGL